MIADTSVIVAAFNKRERPHKTCALLLAEWAGRFVIPAPVVTEVSQLLVSAKRGGGPWLEAEFLRAVSGMWVECPAPEDYARASALVDRYAACDGGEGIGAVDALIVAIAERFEEPKVATLDRTHFSLIRPAHVDGFHLFP